MLGYARNITHSHQPQPSPRHPVLQRIAMQAQDSPAPLVHRNPRHHETTGVHTPTNVTQLNLCHPLPASTPWQGQHVKTPTQPLTTALRAPRDHFMNKLSKVIKTAAKPNPLGVQFKARDTTLDHAYDVAYKAAYAIAHAELLVEAEEYKSSELARADYYKTLTPEQRASIELASVLDQAEGDAREQAQHDIHQNYYGYED